jgi:hypothetical protein
LSSRIARVWALVGVSLLLGFAIIRLGGRGVESVASGLTATQWTVLVASVGFFVYAEGVKALQLRWVPRVVERARTIGAHSGPVRTLLAPFHAMSLVGAPAPAMMRAWLLVAAVITAVYLVRLLPDPWRGIIDLSVAAALGWGLLFLLVGIGKALSGPEAKPITPE